jgi:hypothetical protein
MNEAQRPGHLKIATRAVRPDEPMYRAIPGFCEEFWQAFRDAEALRPLTDANMDEYHRLSAEAELLNPFTAAEMSVYGLLEGDSESGDVPEWMDVQQIAAFLDEPVTEVTRILAALVEHGAVEMRIERPSE